MKLELQILTSLRNAGGHLLPMSTLVAELRLMDRPESLAQIQSALAEMEAAGEVVGIFNRDAGAKWKIADPGKARLAEAGI
jgi:hypothetical protein